MEILLIRPMEQMDSINNSILTQVAEAVVLKRKQLIDDTLYKIYDRTEEMYQHLTVTEIQEHSYYYIGDRLILEIYPYKLRSDVYPLSEDCIHFMDNRITVDINYKQYIE